MARPYYLDTSIIRSSLVGHSAIKRYLFDKYKHKVFITSKFVKCEFERKFVCDLIAFYFVLKNQKSIEDACNWWGEEFGARKLKNFLSLCSKIFSRTGSNKTKALFNLSEEIKAILVGFHCLIRRFENDNTKCYLARVEIDFETADTREKVEEEFYKFYNFFEKKNYVDRCEIIKLFGDKKVEIKKMLDKQTANQGFRRQKVVVGGLVDEGKEFSCNKCKVIADTVIVLECPNSAILLTQDNAFDELCPVFDKDLEKIPSLRSLLPASTVLAELRNPR